MICTGRTIKYTYGKSVTLKIISDVHWGNAHCDVRAFRKYISDEDAYFIGNGDYLDAIVTSDLKRYRKSSDDTKGDDIIDQQINKMVDMLMPIKDRILGLGIGNHEDVITKKCGTNPVARICTALGVPILGYSSLFRLALQQKGKTANRMRSRVVTIRMHHGWGGGSRTQGGDITKFSKDMCNWDADLFLYGHVHRLAEDRVARLGITAGHKFISKSMHLGICGTFLKTFSSTLDPTYSEVKGYPPAFIGGLTITITPNKIGYEMKVAT